MHSLLSFLLIGIGADDMFVICNALDQTDLNLSVEQRFKKAFSEAGPSITITSFTNAISFLVGSTTSLIALSSFCVYAAFAILMLYSTALSLFSCILAWDTMRVHKRRGDCCGLCCCCKEDALICCKAAFLNSKQKEFSKLIEPKTESAKPGEIIYSSRVEEFLGTKLAPEILSTEGKISLIGIYLVIGVISAVGCSNLKIDFDIQFFIGPSAYVSQWFNLNDEYFKKGD